MKKNFALIASFVIAFGFSQLKDISLFVKPAEDESVHKLASYTKKFLETLGYSVNIDKEYAFDQTAEFLIQFQQGNGEEYSVSTTCYKDSSKKDILKNLAVFLQRGLTHTGLKQGVVTEAELGTPSGFNGVYREVVINLGNFSYPINAQYYKNETNLIQLAEILANQIKVAYPKK